MTFWPGQWANLRKLAPPTSDPVEISVGPFSGPELDLVLAGHDLSRERFAEPMLKVPRLSRLAITRHQALGEGGDITPERLAYEDWKYRVSRCGAFHLGHDLAEMAALASAEAPLQPVRRDDPTPVCRALLELQVITYRWGLLFFRSFARAGKFAPVMGTWRSADLARLLGGVPCFQDPCESSLTMAMVRELDRA